MTDERGPRGRIDALSRRSFLKGSGGALAGGVLAQGASARSEASPQAASVEGRVRVTLEINGAPQTLEVEPRTTLLSALRHHLDQPLTGTKEVCDRGNCGACTVIVDGRAAYACMHLAVDLVGRSIRTVEGLGTPEALHPVQKAFCEQDGLMCGFCTPGFVMATTACLEREPDASPERIREKLSGNLCRCGTYPHVFAAAAAAQQAMQEGR